MPIKLPQAVEGYFTPTNKRDPDGMLALFDATAVVKDEGEERRGTSAIRRWIQTTTDKYRHTLEVLDAEAAGGVTTVTPRVTGNFRGSPIDLRHEFTLAGPKISRLEIHP
jgi:SnoaL-like domain